MYLNTFKFVILKRFFNFTYLIVQLGKKINFEITNVMIILSHLTFITPFYTEKMKINKKCVIL